MTYTIRVQRDGLIIGTEQTTTDPEEAWSIFEAEQIDIANDDIAYSDGTTVDMYDEQGNVHASYTFAM